MAAANNLRKQAKWDINDVRRERERLREVVTTIDNVSVNKGDLEYLIDQKKKRFGANAWIPDGVDAEGLAFLIEEGMVEVPEEIATEVATSNHSFKPEYMYSDMVITR